MSHLFINILYKSIYQIQCSCWLVGWYVGWLVGWYPGWLVSLSGFHAPTGRRIRMVHMSNEVSRPQNDPRGGYFRIRLHPGGIKGDRSSPWNFKYLSNTSDFDEIWIMGTIHHIRELLKFQLLSIIVNPPNMRFNPLILDTFFFTKTVLSIFMKIGSWILGMKMGNVEYI